MNSAKGPSKRKPNKLLLIPKDRDTGDGLIEGIISSSKSPSEGKVQQRPSPLTLLDNLTVVKGKTNLLTTKTKWKKSNWIALWM